MGHVLQMRSLFWHMKCRSWRARRLGLCLTYHCLSIYHARINQSHGCFCLVVVHWVIWDMWFRSTCVVEFPSGFLLRQFDHLYISAPLQVLLRQMWSRFCAVSLILQLEYQCLQGLLCVHADS